MRHAHPALKEAKLKKNLLEGLQPLRAVLADLEVDMRTNMNHSYGHIRFVCVGVGVVGTCVEKL